MKRVLVSQKEPKSAQELAALLSEQGLDALAVRTGAEILPRVQEEPWDLIILDAELPKADGFAICRQVREGSVVPVMFLTGSGGDERVVQGLNVGADDYVVKPVSAQVFLARLFALLRRAGRLGSDGATGVIRRGSLVIDLDQHAVSVCNKTVSLTPSEFRLLTCLVENPGRVLSPRSLVKEIQGYECSPEEARSIIKVHVHNLRRKVSSRGKHPFHIINVRGVGYMFDRRKMPRERDLNFLIT